MNPTRNPSTIPNGFKMLLPSTNPNPSSDIPSPPRHPPATCYAIKLTEFQLQQLQGLSKSAFIEFQTNNSGIISLGGPSETQPLKFQTRPIGDADDSASACLFSRRSTTARFVGPITAEMELDPTSARHSVSQRVKKRTQDDLNQAKSRQIPVDDNLVPAPAPKRARKPEKRPRSTRPRPLSTGLSSALAPKTSNGQVRPPPRNLSSFSPSRPSPVVSPGRPPPSNGALTSHQNGSRRSTPTGVGSSAMASQRPSPNGYSLTGMLAKPPRSDSADGAVRPPVPKSSLRSMTPIKVSKVSPSGSQGSSRGLSPMPPSDHSPSSPRIGNLRPRSLDHVELRRHVIHVLALGSLSMQEIRRRVLGSDLTMEVKDRFNEVLHEVGVDVSGQYSLKKSLWKEVRDDYEKYTDLERTRVRSERPSGTRANGAKTNGVVEPKPRGVNGKSEFSADPAIKECEAEMAETTVVTCEADELRLRKSFHKWYPKYSGVIEELERMERTFRELNGRYHDARSAAERENIAREITTNYERHRRRHDELIKFLPRLHARLRSIRDSLEDWAKPPSKSARA